MDACAMVKETEREIQRLRKQKGKMVDVVVAGSNPNFPYQPQNFHISGTEPHGNDKKLRRQERVLEERKSQAERVKEQTEAWMDTIPMRMQRIIKYKIFEGLSWEETAGRLGRKATGDSVKKEYQRFMKEK